MTLKTCVREGCEKTFDDPPRLWTQPRLYCSPECRNAVGYAREKAKKAMAKDIPEETTDDAPEPRYSPDKKRAAVLAALRDGKKQLRGVVDETGLPRSTVHMVLTWLIDEGQVIRPEYGFYSLAPGVEIEPPCAAETDRDTKPANPTREPPAPVEEAPAEDDPVVFTPEETGILAYLAKPGLLALLAKVERLG